MTGHLEKTGPRWLRVLLCFYFALSNMARKRSIGICDQTWSALLIAAGASCGVRSAFR